MLERYQLENILPFISTIISIYFIIKYWNITSYKIISILLILIGLTLWWSGKITLGRSFDYKPNAKTLITNGIYSKIRNPIYLGLTLLLLGFTLYFNSKIFLIITILITISSVIRIKLEETILKKKFGKDYLEYKNKTWF